MKTFLHNWLPVINFCIGLAFLWRDDYTKATYFTAVAIFQHIMSEPK